MALGDKEWIRSIADLLEVAEARRAPMAPLDEQGLHELGLDLARAYEVQREIHARRMARGESYIGFKAAVTTRRKLAELQLHAPLIGSLPASGLVQDGAAVDASRLIRPRIEPELAFILGEPLSGPACHAAQVLAATRMVAPAFEIIDSRIAASRFHAFSAVADNVSTSHYVLGAGRPVAPSLELGCLGVAVQLNGELHATGASAQVFGHPAIAVAELVNELYRQGVPVPAGSIILSGGIVEAFPVRAGDHVRAEFQGLGALSVRFG